jgi:CRISPR-associated protein Cas2
MAYIWIFYDISKNAARTRIAKICKKAGLRRVQKSVFFGKVRDSDFTLLTQTLHKKINPLTDRLAILPDDKTVFNRLKSYGQLTTHTLKDLWTRRINFV